jgi:Na+/proline symporter
MQKNLSCRSLREAQWNLYAFSGVMVVVNTIILGLGVLLFSYAERRAIVLPTRSDEWFPELALQHLGVGAAVVFVIGLTAATFNSADSVLTTLTTSFCLDFLQFDSRSDWSEAVRNQVRRLTHLGFAGLLLGVMLALPAVAGRYPVIDLVLKLSGYTGGPLLALFGLGLFTSIRVGGRMVPVICVGSGTCCALLEAFPRQLAGGYHFGFELLLLNASICAVCLVIFSRLPERAPGSAPC